MWSKCFLDPFMFSLIIEWKVQKRVQEQFNAFHEGFHEIIPMQLVRVFDERELEVHMNQS
jgi:hypothetical protein